MINLMENKYMKMCYHTTMVPKPENEWDEDDYKKEGVHAKAMNVIMCYHP